MIFNRLTRYGLKLNRTNSIIINSSNNSYNNIIYNGLNKRSFCTDNKLNGDEGESDITKLFKITQEITQELGHTDEISPLLEVLEEEEDDDEGVNDLITPPVGVMKTLEGMEETTKPEYSFPTFPIDMALLPVNEAPASIEDLMIEYTDPFDTIKPTTYAPFFRFAEPRGYTVESFLQKIGRDCESHVELFPTWEDLMSTTSRKLKDQQVPVRNRKWILHWVEQFKQGRDPVFVSKAKSIAKVNKKK